MICSGLKILRDNVKKKLRITGNNIIMFHLNIPLLLKVKNSYMFCLAEVPIIRLNMLLTFNNKDVCRQNISILFL